MKIRGFRYRHKVGLPPGSLLPHGDDLPAAVARVLRYGPESCTEVTLAPGDAFPGPTEAEPVVWVHVDGVHDVSLVEGIGAHYGLHRLVLEDVMNVEQRPKLDAFEDYLFLTLKMVHFEAGGGFEVDPVSIVVGKGFVISFQGGTGPVFDTVRGRARAGGGTLRANGVDYLAYRLVDSVIDHYFVALEEFGERLAALEDEVLAETSSAVLGDLHRCRRQLSSMRRAAWPARDAVNGLRRAETSVFGASTTPFLADVYDHTVQVIDTLESLRETALSLMDTRLALAGQRMNEIMKVLTMIATIFIPLGFLAGLYGMNFKYMPELDYPWAYPALLVVMACTAGGMLLFFRRKEWL